MGRPKRVIFEKFGEYDKLHTIKTKMICGVEQTTLYPIKETKEFYISPEVWAYCASKFRMKKKNVTLGVDIPVIDSDKVSDFLLKHCWEDWVKKEGGNSDISEAVALLDKLFPDHEKLYFYELNSLLTIYNQGTLISLDDNGNSKPMNDNRLKRINYYVNKYAMFYDELPDEILELKTAWHKCKDEKKRPELMDIFLEKQSAWAFENLGLLEIFIEIGKNSVCYPVAFSNGTGMWGIEKYGKPTEYSNAGEIFFVVTKDKIFFDISRHF